MRAELARFLPAPLAAGLAAIAVRTLLGFHFPVPWPDETQFISPAYDLIETGSLFDPGLDPDRVGMAMPPGYSLLLAAVFEIFGPSYAAARWVSTFADLAMLAAIARVAWLLTAGGARILAGLVTGLAFLSPYVLIDSNLARMELVLGAAIGLALLLGVTGRLWGMAALVGGSAVIHFNAVWFVPAVLLAFGDAVVRRRLVLPDAFEAVLFGAGLLSVVAYALYAALHWSGLVADMRFQFRFHAMAAGFDPDRTLWMTVCAVGLASLRLVLSRGVDSAAVACLFGAGFVAMGHAGHEMWYDEGEPVGFALIACAFLSDASKMPVLGSAVAATAVVLMVFAAFRITAQMRELLPRPAMLHEEFLSADERREIGRVIAKLHPGDTVDFGLTGVENFFLVDLHRVGAHWIMMAHALTRTMPMRSATVRIACDSPAIPPTQRRFEFDLPRTYAGPRCYIAR